MFKSIDKAGFLKHYWQQNAAVFTKAFANVSNITDGNELAGFACNDLIDSRIISGHDLDGDWQCKHGPFDTTTFAKLADQNWTLLVQSVDQYHQGIANILEQFDFLPSWRLDDIMASYAPIGGGVGPHFDYYDVFLIQASGRRQWKLGQQCDEQSELKDNDQVKLLATFDTQQTHELDAGDMIYIPAGQAHWGTALSDDCITLSVGFRAPSEQQIITQALDVIIENLALDPQFSDHRRYNDKPGSIDSQAHKINSVVQQNLKTILAKITQSQLESAVTKAFGQLVTEANLNHLDDDLSTDYTLSDVKQLIDAQGQVKLMHKKGCRFAFTEQTLFVNGESYPASEPLASAICNQVLNATFTDAQLELVVELLNLNYLSLDSSLA